MDINKLNGFRIMRFIISCLFSGQSFFRFIMVSFAFTGVTGCLDKIDKELPPIEEYQSSEGWYEDAFVRIYKRNLYEGGKIIQDNFTHPSIVVKRSYSEDLFSFELSEVFDPDFDCDQFSHINPTATYQLCGYIRSIHGNALDSIDKLEKPYSLGEIRGREDVNQIAAFILDQSKHYACRNEYNVINRNSNTYVRAMLEFSGFYDLYEEVNEEPFSMGTSSFGQNSWDECPIEEALLSIQ